MNNTILNSKKYVDVVKYRWLWFAFTMLLIIPGIVAMIYSSTIYPNHGPLRLGLDFTGGTQLTYSFNQNITNEQLLQIREKLAQIGIENPIIQKENVLNEAHQTPANGEAKTDSSKNAAINDIVSIRTHFLQSEKGNNEIQKVTSTLQDTFSGTQLMQVDAIGPTLGQELFKNSMLALLLAFGAIVAYLSFRFQTDYAIMALFSLLHDALFVVGAFSILGLLFNTTVDSLFITAILTVIGFSVHDTIVVFDRIRENSRFLTKKVSFNEIVNASVNQTLARSINTSLTTLLTLLALYFLGGTTTKDFVLAMILGIIVGTYSSIFFASMLLAWWRERSSKPATAR